MNRDLDFEFGKATDIDSGCAAVFKDKMMYFGSRIPAQQRQVRLLEYFFQLKNVY